MRHLPLRQVATPSDEALGLLLLENSEAIWTLEFQKKMDGHKAERVEIGGGGARYTTSGSNKASKGFTRKYKGWSQEGIIRFNVLLERVKMDRKQNGAWFDEKLEYHLSSHSGDEAFCGGRGEDDDNCVVVQAGNDLFLEEDEDQSNICDEEPNFPFQAV